MQVVPESPRETLELMLGHLGFVFDVNEAERDGQLILSVSTRDPGRLIGRDGHTLEDLQYLLNRLVHAGEDDIPRVIVEVEGYRLKKSDDPVTRAQRLAEKVRQSGKAIRLPRMNSFDRRLIHHAFADDPDIMTVSEEGDSRHKYIMLEPKHGNE